MPDDEFFPERWSSKIRIADVNDSRFPSSGTDFHGIIGHHVLDHPVFINAISIGFAARCRSDVSGTRSWLATVFDSTVDNKVADLKSSLRHSDRYLANERAGVTSIAGSRLERVAKSDFRLNRKLTKLSVDLTARAILKDLVLADQRLLIIRQFSLIIEPFRLRSL